ncbi:MAG: DNA alkylation repair protein [Patescibacteria group bacterium]|nr:DNA alkylation repair protein [Patescibacteria group bacterium]
MNLAKLKTDLRQASSPAKAKVLQSFFKTGKGEYGEGDIFLGITVPRQRALAKKYETELSANDLEKLLKSKIHEERLVGILILVAKFQKGEENEKGEVFRFYLKHTRNINNWDLVDLSAPNIVGEYLLTKDRETLYQLAGSHNLWEKRIAILSTFAFIKRGQSRDALAISQILFNDSHDLIHKAVGWMLREVGKRCDQKILTDFLDKHATIMPRTMLRYAIERLPEKTKKNYLKR